jgi:hypothetical protein
MNRWLGTSLAWLRSEQQVPYLILLDELHLRQLRHQLHCQLHVFSCGMHAAGQESAAKGWCKLKTECNKSRCQLNKTSIHSFWNLPERALHTMLFHFAVSG